MGDAHAVADHENDVFGFRVADGGAEVDDFEIARRDHRLAVRELGRADAESVRPGGEVAVGAQGGDEGVGGKAGDRGGRERYGAGDFGVVHVETHAGDILANVGRDGCLKVEALTGQEACDVRWIRVLERKEAARRGQARDDGSGGGRGERSDHENGCAQEVVWAIFHEEKGVSGFRWVR